MDPTTFANTKTPAEQFEFLSTASPADIEHLFSRSPTDTARALAAALSAIARALAEVTP